MRAIPAFENATARRDARRKSRVPLDEVAFSGLWEFWGKAPSSAGLLFAILYERRAQGCVAQVQRRFCLIGFQTKEFFDDEIASYFSVAGVEPVFGR